MSDGPLTELPVPSNTAQTPKPKPVQLTLPDTLPGVRQVNIYDALKEQA